MAEDNKVVVREVIRHMQLFCGGWCVCGGGGGGVGGGQYSPLKISFFYLILRLLRVVVRNAETVLRSQ